MTSVPDPAGGPPLPEDSCFDRNKPALSSLSLQVNTNSSFPAAFVYVNVNRPSYLSFWGTTVHFECGLNCEKNPPGAYAGCCRPTTYGVKFGPRRQETAAVLQISVTLLKCRGNIQHNATELGILCPILYTRCGNQCISLARFNLHLVHTRTRALNRSDRSLSSFNCKQLVSPWRPSQ